MGPDPCGSGGLLTRGLEVTDLLDDAQCFFERKFILPNPLQGQANEGATGFRAMGVNIATPFLKRSTGLDQNMSVRLFFLHLKPQELHGISLARPLELDIGKKGAIAAQSATGAQG